MLGYFPLMIIYADPYKNEYSKVKFLSLCWIEIGDEARRTLVLALCTLYIKKKNTESFLFKS